MDFLMSWRIPKLPDFQSAYPNIEIKLTSGREDPDFRKGSPDVAIRYGLGQWDGLQADLIFGDELLPSCSPLLLKHMSLSKPEDLLKATVYHAHVRRHEWPQWFSLVSEEPFKPAREIYPEDPAVAHECVIQGMGFGLGQRQYITDDIAAGRLITPFNTPLKLKTGFYLTYKKDDTSPKLAAFRNWVLSQTCISSVN